MATIGQTYLTLSDLKGREDPDGSMATLIEQASYSNHMIQDALLLEGNQSSGHKGTIRIGLPTGTYRVLYGGVQPERSTTKQVVDTVGILEGFSELDEHVYEMASDGDLLRAQEDQAYLEGMMQTQESRVFYGNTATAPEEFMGLAPRFNARSGAETSQNVFHGGGAAADNTSIYLITWGDRMAHTFYGKGTKAGFQMENLGKDTVTADNGGYYMAYRTHFKWQLGFHVADWRYCGRLCNIDAGDRDSDPVGTMTALRANLIRLIRSRPDMRGRAALYMNKATQIALEIAASDSSSSSAGMALKTMEWFGQPINSIWGIPIRVADTISDSEALVPA